MKILPVAAELFHAGGPADGHDLANSRFSQFFESAYKRKDSCLPHSVHITVHMSSILYSK